MEYLSVRWNHHSPGDPVLMYSELDEERWERRKVEIYADGRADFAEAIRQTGMTRLGDVPVPALDAIAADPEFEPRVISREEFEEVWNRVTRS